MFAEQSAAIQEMILTAVNLEVRNRISKGVEARLFEIAKQLPQSEGA